ncbi:adenylate/guanylate cyclase domain-containing protein [Sphingomonas lycopersici]|uniref:Adenylate/guanylate cyclase domain-containing protein n=1 Tax=Sphingomonas lycopersici TaxID=2951807 RepID=A0AA41Z5L2_9SPHN|nr:adenylate/guanylate cyclase domain-containing protein [Sphingomonas lycopersici]MCW6533303.1 adenylate/guanylate cyclase domain-containing protein [Sphingomonas lycopersici]
MRVVRDAGRGRLAAAGLVLALALFVAGWDWGRPLGAGTHAREIPTADAERGLYDWRAATFAPRVAQDKRIVMIVYDDQTLIATRKRSPLDRGLLARALRNLDAMGAHSIGVDILFDQPQDEDNALLAALRAMRTPVWLGYANLGDNREQIIFEQQQYLDRFIRAARTDRVRPASIRLETDSDNVARSWPTPQPGQPPLLALAMRPAAAFADYRGAIRYRLPQPQPDRSEEPVIPSLQIDLIADPAMSAALAPMVRGRDVLIGGDIVDIDQFETPLSGRGAHSTMIGLEVHATMLAQVLDGARLRTVPVGVRWLAAALVVLAAAATSLAELRWLWLGPALVVQAGAIGGLPLVLQANGWDTKGLPAAGWAIAWIFAFTAVGVAARAVTSQQRRFAQSALGKYLPRDIATQILQEPEKLALHGEKRAIFTLFTDLEGFTKLSHAIAPEMVAQLLNRYLDMLSDVVLAHGGTIDKFVGDAVVAFWGAPIARDDDARNAAQAAYAMWQAGEAFRRDLPAGVPPIGRTRVGLHHGDAIVGNFGGEGRIQYTALGDSMNTASRLESANKKLDTNVLASREAMILSGLDWWRAMGRVRLRGRQTPVDIFEPAPDFPAEERAALGHIVAALDAGACRDAALADLRAMIARHPRDAALANLLNRYEHIEGGAYDLG